MRIGELAGIVGVTTRAVRHYHRIGLLPEPPRQANGYREYTLRDAVELARVRRLTELGLSLDEVKDALADDAGRDLAEILAELDADLARQEDAIRQRRARLRQLLDEAERSGRLPAEAPVSPELAAIFEDMARASAQRPGPEPAIAAKERELLALLATGTPDAGRDSWLGALMQSLTADPEAMRRAYDVYARLDELAAADDGDPRIEPAAHAIVAAIPPEAARKMAAAIGGAVGQEGGFADAFFADYAPAQAAAIRRAVELLKESAP
ncbi:MerR family transcriptional regulator [Yinghuangia soli]|uniref:MerR family transcriptional regulator n=1 Tax=Yinghuangia soli TaxID=2908204 RepID=A0AA41U5Z8_9ACTN|nr:MerR family transcriptional regulator [Yinghuangia soli]MCF2530489.1 MerR family transcriptional regulator [Yinghuangia soli]